MRLLLAFAVLLTAPWTAQAAPAGVSQVQIQGNQVVIDVDVAGLYTARVRVTFENVLGLNASALDVSAASVDPLDPQLLSRLPALSIDIPTAYPIVLDVSPAAGSGLTFTGVAEIDVSTRNLSFDPSFRLFTAHAGGTFEDITNFSGVGSYRVRGTTGDFSEFLIVADTRLTSSVVHAKFSQLQASLDAYDGQIESGVFDQLQTLLDSAFSNYQTGLSSAAVDDMESFELLVKDNQGSNIPDVYRANDPATQNVAGRLRSQAATLAFSLKLM